jgi:CRP-like cAMP-binding protein
MTQVLETRGPDKGMLVPEFVTIRIWATEQGNDDEEAEDYDENAIGGWMYEVNLRDAVYIDGSETSDYTGLCTGSLVDAIGMARDAALEAVKKNTKQA